MRYLEFSVPEDEAGRRVDAVLRRRGLSTYAIRRANKINLVIFLDW